MDDKAQVRLVEAHPQRGRSHKGLHLVVFKELFRTLPVGRVSASCVGEDIVPGLGQESGRIFSRRDRERVDDAAARHICQMCQ
ncbi:hypothetical protein D3C85_1518000 [compost metagenome]